MSQQPHILEALATVPMNGAEIGRGFAPEYLKDREGWGRKWLKAAILGKLVRAIGDRWTSAAPRENVAAFLLSAWLVQATPRDYRAPHANRPTPPRPRWSRYSRKPRFCNH